MRIRDEESIKNFRKMLYCNEYVVEEDQVNIAIDTKKTAYVFGN